MPTSTLRTPSRRVIAGLIAVSSATSMSCRVVAHDADAPPERAEKFGSVQFPTSCKPNADAQFQRAVAMLHSFWYPETVRAFTEVIQSDPECTIAYWGLAMSYRPNPLVPPDEKVSAKGLEAVEKGLALGTGTQREKDYVNAAASYYRDYRTMDYRARAAAQEAAMEQVYRSYPDDPEAAVFYGLALIVTAVASSEVASDASLQRQIKAGEILEKVWAEHPNHPGVVHYIIHAYDDPSLARRALDAANRYANIAPSAPHALHMPSHTYSTLGMWQESIDSNKASWLVSKDYAEHNWPGASDPVQLHSMDFLVAAYLQTGQDRKAKAIVDERMRITKLAQERLSTQNALNAIPARYALERAAWSEAADLTPVPPDPSKFPQAEAITWFARCVGAARVGERSKAREALAKQEQIRQGLQQGGQPYWAAQTQLHMDACAAWVALRERRTDEALQLMRGAVDLQDKSGRHPSMENRLMPMREQLGDMLIVLKRYDEAAAGFERSLEVDPNRFRGVYGAAKANQLAGNRQKAAMYYSKLLDLTAHADTLRQEAAEAKAVLSASNNAVQGR